jgi:hypothetical protein
MDDADHYEAFRCTGPEESSFELWDNATGRLVLCAVARDGDAARTFEGPQAGAPGRAPEWFRREARRQFLGGIAERIAAPDRPRD